MNVKTYYLYAKGNIVPHVRVACQIMQGKSLGGIVHNTTHWFFDVHSIIVISENPSGYV